MYIFIPHTCILISLFTCIFFFCHLGFNSSLQHTFPLLIIQRSSITIPVQIDSLPSFHVPTSKCIHPWHKDYVIFLDSFQESLTQNMSKSRSMFSHHLLLSPHFHEHLFCLMKYDCSTGFLSMSYLSKLLVMLAVISSRLVAYVNPIVDTHNLKACSSHK